MTARILVVDDVDSNVKLLEARLLSEYYEVVPAYSGAEAIEICLDGQIDIVLLDVLMPGLDGFEVCRRLKANPRTANIPVIMITCLTSPEDKVRGLEAGAEDFLSKPVNDLELLSRLKSLTRLKMMSDELFQRAGRIADAEVDASLRARWRVKTAIKMRSPAFLWWMRMNWRPRAFAIFWMRIIGSMWRVTPKPH